MGVTSYLWPASCTFVNERGKIPARETIMTGCIVGWAHTPFGRLDTETVESLIVRVATDALTDGLVIVRYLFGLRGSALVAGAIGVGATRTTPQIEAYIQTLMQ